MTKYYSTRGLGKSHAQLKREIAEVLAGGPRSRYSSPTPGVFHVIQGNYGYGHGWEDLTAETSPKEARDRLREYRENEPGTPFRKIRRREPKKIGTKSTGLPKQAHARKKKLDPHEAKQRLRAQGVNFSADFHALPSSQVQRLVEMARATGYRKRKDAPGSTARMYFQYLSRLK